MIIHTGELGYIWIYSAGDQIASSLRFTLRSSQ